ncbi:cellulose binding domain-containing protein [Streptomyces sp. NPDC101209]|uniref:cellulose binding domain-containing protein n=1 Tax=Streptomyces sp. NPDC101209 TaxID=3366129 RepID=UPI00380BBA5D
MASTRRRQQPRRRVWAKVKLLLLVAVVAAGATALYPLWKKAHPDPPELTVRYRTATPATAPAAEPSLEIFNESKKALPLSEVSLRYYFTADGGSYAFNCVQAAVGCSRVAGSVVALDKPAKSADHYLEIRFSAGAGTLRPGANSRGIDLQLYRVDHKELDQSDDRSFDAGKTTYKESEKVTAYKRGILAWGEEPDGSTPGGDGKPAAPDAAGPAPGVPSGVLFDDFHYTGPKDPALFKHGWLVRTSDGGPGIDDTWSADGVTFPGEKDALGAGQVLNLRASTDGTKAGTKQASLGSAGREFTSGTYAARIHFSDDPTTGRNGDHVNQTFYTIGGKGPTYSELDNEYLPNGGWGRFGPKLDNVTWHTVQDRVYNTTLKSLAGWHTVVMTVQDGVVTYRVDGRKIYRTSGKYAPRAGMSVNFNTWFIDLPFKGGERAWDMKVDWLYYNSQDALSLEDVDAAVKDYSTNGMHYFNTTS